jgi:hypothetical protein
MSTNVEINLGTEAVTYVKECLASGNTLATLLLQSHNIDNGSVVTFLPIGTSDADAKKFKSGGKLPTLASESHKEITADDGSKWRMVPKPNTKSELVTIIQDFLRAKQEHICIFEDAVSAPTDPWLLTSGTRVLIFNNEVYHCLTQDDVAHTNRILSTINRTTTWRFIGALTSVPDGKTFAFDTRTLTNDDLKAVATKTKIIVIGAYDGEGYLIWKQ